MIMKILGNRFLNSSLERTLDGRFSTVKNVVLFLFMFLLLSLFVVEKILAAFFPLRFKLG